MKSFRILCMLLICGCLLSSTALAAEVDCDATYCFTPQDFSQADDPLVGICITGLPQQNGAVMLGNRILRPGDILTAEQVAQMTFCPVQNELDTQAVISYLPIYQGRVAPAAEMTISIRGKHNEAPVAQDSAAETYKNIPNEGRLKASDPEGQALTYTLLRAPRRGDVVLNQDGTFLYTPKKNKVGVDSFTFTATDPAGNVSREATVTIQILKPSDGQCYKDTESLSCRFEAEWLRNTGLFEGERVNDQLCFQPDKPVSRGEFLAMVVKLMDIPTNETVSAGIPEDTPQWLRPYLAAAIRSGLTAQLPDTDAAHWASEAITGGEAAVMLQNALDLSIGEQALETAAFYAEDTPTWATTSLAVMADNGIDLSANEALTRAAAAQVLYDAGILALEAPGMAVFRMER
jgi:hypothetical protein